MSDSRAVHKRFASILLENSAKTNISEEDRLQLHNMLMNLSESAASGSSCLVINIENLTLFEKLEQDLPWLTIGKPTLNKNSPVLLESRHLYLNKYYFAEREIEDGLKALSGVSHQVNENEITSKVSSLDYMNDAGREVILRALKQNLSVITGGPGTGKTTLVVRVLALLIEHEHQKGNENIAIEILAPTGKASARVKESIVKQKRQWLVDLKGFDQRDIEAIPEEARTVQKFLGINPKTRKTRYTDGKKASVDIVVVDEASMLDVLLVKELLSALKPTTRLILLGDPFQLASVEAGNVLAQIVSASGVPGGEWLQGCCTELKESHRFSSDSGIGQLAFATNKGDMQKASTLLNDEKLNDIKAGSIDDSYSVAAEGYHEYKSAILAARKTAEQGELSQDQIKAIFAAFETWQVFSPFRTGLYGVKGLNAKIEELLGWGKEQTWYFGKPVIVTSNDHSLKLYNGDIGICLDTEGKTVCFPAADLSEEEDLSVYRYIKTRILPDYQKVYAMTVHKSQGSEYDRCLLVVPKPNENQQRLLTREILYTAITRAKKGFSLLAAEPEIRVMIETPTKRMSGLLRPDSMS